MADNSIIKITHEEIEYLRDEIYSAREYAVFSYRMGLSDGVRHSLEETANKFEVTGERVHQIELKAIRFIRRIRRKPPKGFLD